MNLTIDYPYPEWGAFAYIIAWIFLIGAAVMIWSLRRRFPSLFFGAAWSAICLLPISGLFYVGTSFTSDRYLYLASAGPLLAILPWLKNAFDKQARLAPVIALAVAAIWAGLSFKQTDIWRNGRTLFEHTTKAQPRSSLGWSNLGAIYQRSGDFTQAIESFENAIKLQPKDHFALFNLGVARNKMGDQEAAQAAYEQALSANPNFLPCLKNLGLLLAEKGDLQEACTLYKRACELTDYRDPVLIWLSCRTELARGDLKSGQKLLRTLEGMSIANQSVLEGMRQARAFLRKAGVDD
ncbi:tetratricopeptide repeat protein [bacterium]|nr:tetratricopeptide repeat protein [bacterium]